MLEQFGDEARLIVQRAARDARRWGFRVIGTGTVLAALLDSHDTALLRLLRDLRVRKSPTARAALQAVLAEEGEPNLAARLFDPPTSRNLRLALSAAQREAAHHVDPMVTPEHLFLGLLASTNSVAAQVLKREGVSLESVRRLASPR